ncbi:MAG: SurA N-terminal domain-containing protein [Verrucomicrobiae bacterium]|nr:SurA N-terminal domain-containing protein [Verrucomicrobiae bacterium]
MKALSHALTFPALVCAGLVVSQFQPINTAAASGFQEINALKAVVNGESITSIEVDTAVATQIQIWLLEHKNDPGLTQAIVDAKVEEMKKEALKDLIDRKLILAEFKKMGGSIKETYVDTAIDEFITKRFKGDRDKFLSELKKSGMTIRQFRDMQREQITIQALRGQNDGPETLINTPTEMQAKYDEIKNEYAEDPEIILRMLSLPKQTAESDEAAQKQLVNDIRKQLQGGADFATMARAHSADSAAADGGLVGGGPIGKDYLNEKLTSIAFGLSPRKVSDVIDDGPYWRLMYVDARQGGAVPSFEELKDTCDKLLTQEKRKGYVDRWLEKLRQDAGIRVYD